MYLSITKQLLSSNSSKCRVCEYQQVSRHVSRLGESKLTQRDTMGFHHISPFYGKLVLDQLLVQCRGYCMLYLSENIYRPSHSFPASLKIDMLLTRLPFH